MSGTLNLPTTGTVSGLLQTQNMNAALASLAGMQQSLTAPTTASTGLSSLAGVWWHDLTTNAIKVRDQADSTWIVVGFIDETNKVFQLVQSAVTGFDNRIINGDFRISQRATSAASQSFTSVALTAAYTTVDRFACNQNSGGGAVFTASQAADHPILSANPGYSFKLLTTTAKGAVGSSDYFYLCQRIEGFNVADILAQGSVCILDFWVKSPKTGQHYVFLANSNQSASLVAGYTVTAANTWERKTITVPFSGAAAVGGGWSYTTSIGLQIGWPLFCGTGGQTATLGTWQNSVIYAGTGQQNLCDAINNAFQITDVQFYVGTTQQAFARRPLAVEVQLCQRYYETGVFSCYCPALSGASYSTSTEFHAGVGFKVTKRATPTISASGGSFGGTASALIQNPNAAGFDAGLNHGSSGGYGGWVSGTWSAAAEI